MAKYLVIHSVLSQTNSQLAGQSAKYSISQWSSQPALRQAAHFLNTKKWGKIHITIESEWSKSQHESLRTWREFLLKANSLTHTHTHTTQTERELEKTPPPHLPPE